MRKSIDPNYLRDLARRSQCFYTDPFAKQMRVALLEAADVLDIRSASDDRNGVEESEVLSNLKNAYKILSRASATFNDICSSRNAIKSAIKEIELLNFLILVCAGNTEDINAESEWSYFDSSYFGTPSEGKVVDVWVSAQADDTKVRAAERIPNAFVENGVWHYTDFNGRVHRIWRKVTHWRHIPDAPFDLKSFSGTELAEPYREAV